MKVSPFSEDRQGICPNGWHIPTVDEWRAFRSFIEDTEGLGLDQAGKHLKTKNGWYAGDAKYLPAQDTY